MVVSVRRRRLLFVTYGGGHVDIVLRLLPVLNTISGLEFSVLALTTAGPRMALAGWRYKGCYDYLPQIGYEHAMEWGAELSKEIWDETTGVLWNESCAYLGVSMVDLIRDVGVDRAQDQYRAKGRQAFCPHHFICTVLNIERPDIVITTCHVRMERAAILAARRLGVASVRIEDLFGYSLLGEYGPGQQAQLLDESEWPDDVVVINNEVKSRLVLAGMPPARIHPLGQPVLSEWLERFNGTSATVAMADWLGEGRPIVTYATPARRDVLYSQTNALLLLAARRPEWGICIKLHPSVGHGEFLQRYPLLPINLRIIADDDILPVVRASNLVMIFRSTVGLLCLSCGIPLLVVDESSEGEVIPYVSSGAARGLNDICNLESTIAEMLAETGSSECPVNPLFHNQAGATKRIAHWLARTDGGEN